MNCVKPIRTQAVFCLIPNPTLARRLNARDADVTRIPFADRGDTKLGGGSLASESMVYSPGSACRRKVRDFNFTSLSDAV